MKKEIVLIHQARMMSTRLPGKVLLEIDGRPLIEYSLERLRQAPSICKIVVATTNNPKDEAIVEYCKSHDIDFYRGDEDDVLSRYYEAAKAYQADYIIRTTSDCPLIDPDVIEKIIKAYFDAENADYASNMLKETYPLGMCVEIFSMEILEEAYQKATERYEKEHVTPYIYMHPEKFSLLSVEQDEDLSFHRWTVDTVQDFNFVEKVIFHLKEKENPFSMKTVLEILKEHPEYMEINRKIKQKGVME
ncbi:MAG: spore coat polysaccharide biosynthesis protein SpsF [Chlamydiales bacterium]|jgi:spore coat polysaccharide biosynthesis protein SpsF